MSAPIAPAAHSIPATVKLVRVSLQQVPLEIRQKAARALTKDLRDQGGWKALADVVEIEAAAIAPSDHGYLLPRQVVEAVMPELLDDEPQPELAGELVNASA